MHPTPPTHTHILFREGMLRCVPVFDVVLFVRGFFFGGGGCIAKQKLFPFSFTSNIYILKEIVSVGVNRGNSITF